MEDNSLIDLSLRGFCAELAGPSSAPGGGSTAALAGALGASLTAMVCNLTIGKKKFTEVDSEMQDILVRANETRDALLEIVDTDTEAFRELMRAYAMPKDSDGERSARSHSIQEATKRATESPLRVMQLCRDALELIGAVAVRGNQNAISDAGVGALLLGAGSEAAALNVRINLPLIHDEQYASAIKHRMLDIEREVSDLEDRVLSIVTRVIEMQG
jgi:formiminotetrahydrofolate cyclodeaminase